MPKFVRNWWLRAQAEGREIAIGPRSKEGGFTIDIKQRSENDCVPALSVRGYVVPATGELRLNVYNEFGMSIHTFTTKR